MSGAESNDSTAAEVASTAVAAAAATTVESFRVDMKSLLELNEKVGNSIPGFHVAEPQTVKAAENVSTFFA